MNHNGRTYRTGKIIFHPATFVIRSAAASGGVEWEGKRFENVWRLATAAGLSDVVFEKATRIPRGRDQPLSYGPV